MRTYILHTTGVLASYNITPADHYYKMYVRNMYTYYTITHTNAHHTDIQ